jgi:hypothetical protein
MFSGRELFGSSAKMLERIRRKRRHDEKFLRCKLSIYRGKGAVSRKRLDTTVAIFPGGTRVHSNVLRVTFFYRNSRLYSWNRIVGVNSLPRGASVGELGKNLTPSKRWICRNSWNKFVNHFGMKSSVSWKGNVHEEILMSLKCFSGLQVICENNS